MTLEKFKEEFENCSRSERIEMFLAYDGEYGNSEVYSFDDDFFDVMFGGNPMEAARAASFGNLNWSDEYIHLNVYGNLESLSDFDVDDMACDAVEDIYEHEDIWKDYIEDEDEDEDEDEGTDVH